MVSLPDYILAVYFYPYCRPIAGFINFCPVPFANLDDETNIRVGIHEVMHALVRISKNDDNYN